MLVIIAVFLDFLLSLILLLPIKDDRGRYQSFPYMTLGLVLINTAIHVFFYGFLPQLIGDTDTWSAVRWYLMVRPVDILAGEGLGALSMITSAFLHAGWSHLIGNMFFLYFFGRKLEDVLGPAQFGLFYLACVFVSSIGSVLGRAALPLTQGRVPELGASGAIMGIVAAYLFLYHGQRIRTLIMLVIIPTPFTLRMPAWVFILYTVARDIINGWLEQQFQAQGAIYSFVNSFAHLGGIVAGLTCLYLYLPRELIHYRHRPDTAL
jgi:membrane associated rhomboid family serine protease